MKLTDQQVIERLARRQGYTGELRYAPVSDCWITGIGLETRAIPDFLHSLDALRPVMETLTPDEWMIIHARLGTLELNSQGFPIGNFWSVWSKHLLTIQPKALAHAIAQAIGEPK